MVRAADTARKLDPQLARICYIQMTERGANHLKACGVVAGHLALRLHAAMLRGAPYQLRDTDGTPPKHVPDNVIAVAGIPHTRTGKKLEVPLKRLMQGAGLDTVVDPQSVDDATLLGLFASIAAEQRSRRPGRKDTARG